VITIGIDPHKSSLTAVALQPSGEVTATIRLEVNNDTVTRLRAWAACWVQRQWAVEGAAGLGRGVAQGLAGADEPVVDVPAQLAARARLLNTGHARKTDTIDAAAVAVVAQHHRRLHPVRAEDDSVVLRLLSQRRDDLAGERTRTANRLHALLRDLIAGGAKRNLTTYQTAALLRGVRPVTAADAARKDLSRELVADLRRLDAALQRNADEIAAAVAAHGTSVTLRGSRSQPELVTCGDQRSPVARHDHGRVTALPVPDLLFGSSALLYLREVRGSTAQLAPAHLPRRGRDAGEYFPRIRRLSEVDQRRDARELVYPEGLEDADRAGRRDKGARTVDRFDTEGVKCYLVAKGKPDLWHYKSKGADKRVNGVFQDHRHQLAGLDDVVAAELEVHLCILVGQQRYRRGAGSVEGNDDRSGDLEPVCLSQLLANRASHLLLLRHVSTSQERWRTTGKSPATCA
jgi:hypothetical protein